MKKKKKETNNANIVEYKNWLEAFPTTPTPPTPPSTTSTIPSPRISPRRSQSGKVFLVSSEPQQSAGHAGGDGGGDGGGGVYVYLDPQRCFPRHLCRIPYDQFNQMITMENEIEIL